VYLLVENWCRKPRPISWKTSHFKNLFGTIERVVVARVLDDRLSRIHAGPAEGQRGFSSSSRDAILERELEGFDTASRPNA
jgi:hypothetical protein